MPSVCAVPGERVRCLLENLMNDEAIAGAIARNKE
jgi:hypothetical protein